MPSSENGVAPAHHPSGDLMPREACLRRPAPPPHALLAATGSALQDIPPATDEAKSTLAAPLPSGDILHGGLYVAPSERTTRRREAADASSSLEGMARRSLEGLVAFLVSCFRYFPPEESFRYLRAARADLRTAVRLVESERSRHSAWTPVAARGRSHSPVVIARGDAGHLSSPSSLGPAASVPAPVTSAPTPHAPASSAAPRPGELRPRSFPHAADDSLARARSARLAVPVRGQRRPPVPRVAGAALLCSGGGPRRGSARSGAGAGTPKPPTLAGHTPPAAPRPGRRSASPLPSRSAPSRAPPRQLPPASTSVPAVPARVDLRPGELRPGGPRPHRPPPLGALPARVDVRPGELARPRQPPPARVDLRRAASGGGPRRGHRRLRLGGAR
nr:uncharacterized protein LOC127347294 [Lolium perenne]